MKIAFVSTSVGNARDGSDILWSEACRSLATMGHQVHVGYPKLGDFPARIQELVDDLKIPLFQIFAPRSPGQRIGRVPLQVLGIVPPGRRAREWLRLVRPDLLCISCGIAFGDEGWMQVAVAERIPFVILTQADWPFVWPGSEEAPRMISLLTEARRCFAGSRGTLQLMQSQLGCHLGNAEVVWPHGASSGDARAPWPESDAGIWRLACVGRLHPPAEGQDLLIDVLRQPQWRERPLLISLYGTGPQERILRRLVEAGELGARVRFCGPIIDAARIWSEHHALIMPSRLGGLSVSVVEAMRCGRMVIVTNVAGSAEVVEHGATGFVAEAPAVTSLIRAMDEAWDARDRWRQMGQRAAAFIRSQAPEDPGAVFAAKLLELARADWWEACPIDGGP